MAWDRRGGRATGRDGEQLTWSLAEGARGIRWREAATRGGALIRAILLEVAPDGSVLRLEIAGAAGLLTLHPEPDASAIHGNVVTPTGIRHLAFGWGRAHALVVDGSVIADAVVVRRLTTSIAVGGHGALAVLAIDDELRPRPGRWTVDRPAVDQWEVRDDATGSAVRSLRIGPDGLAIPGATEVWPLEP